MALAFMQYVQDYDETFPSSQYYGQGWAWRIYPYVKSAAVFTCPDDTHTIGNKGWSVISYAANANVMQYSQIPNTNGYNAYTLAGLVSPSSTVLVYEGSQPIYGYNGPGTGTATGSNFEVFDTSVQTAYGWAPGGYVGYSLDGDGSSNWYDVPIDTSRHSHDPAVNGAVYTGSLNYIACDGHCKYLNTSWLEKAGGRVSVGMIGASNPPDWPNQAVTQENLGNFTMSFNPT